MEQQLHQLLNQLGYQGSQLDNEARLVHDLGLDSLDVAELLLITEQRNLRIPDADYSRLGTVGDLVRYLTKHSGGPRSGE